MTKLWNWGSGYRAVSIYDVAQRAGVSIATVSRFLNGSAAVSEKKAQAVQEAMEFFQYEPNQFARGLMKQSSNMIGVYFPEGQGSMFDSSYNLELLKGIEQALSYQNYSMVLLDEAKGFSQRKRPIPRYLEYVRQKRLDGLILSGLSNQQMKHEVFQQIMEEDFPVVYIGKRVHEKGLNVYAQFEQYHVDMLDTLRQSGHRKILMLIYYVHSYYLPEIAAQVEAGMPEITLFPVIIDNTDDYREQLMQAVQQYVADEGCTAVVTEGMEETQILLSICAELQIAVPNQLSILSPEHRRGGGNIFFPGFLPASFQPKQWGAARRSCWSGRSGARRSKRPLLNTKAYISQGIP